MKKLRGVNLGGWLVLERWITPSVFDGSEARDEYELASEPDGPLKISRHQSQFIGQEDFEWMRDNGINAVRIPIGYWIFDGDSPYASTLRHLDWAVKMAKLCDIQVLICLHGAPGSQNGRDHSGRIGKAEWYRRAAYREQTIDVLEQLARRYKTARHVWGIELLNEPLPGLFQLKLRRFYQTAYDRVARAGRPGLTIVFHDAFTPRLMRGAIRPFRNYPAVMDVHWYHFTLPLYQIVPIGWYFRMIDLHGRLLRRLKVRQPIIIGEWSMVLAGNVLRRYRQSRHEPLMSEHLKRQLVAYEAADGWFYWTYKTESPGIWNFRSLVEDDTVHLR